MFQTNITKPIPQLRCLLCDSSLCEIDKALPVLQGIRALAVVGIVALLHFLQWASFCLSVMSLHVLVQSFPRP